MHSINKTSLKSIVTDDRYLEAFNKLAIDVSRLRRHALYFFKFCFLDIRDLEVSQVLIESILYLCNNGRDWNPKDVKKLALKDRLLSLFDRYCTVAKYTPTLIKNVQQIINYLKITIITNMKVNIKQHFFKKLMQYVNLRLDVKSLKKRKQKDALKMISDFKESLIDGVLDATKIDTLNPTLIKELQRLQIFPSRHPIPLSIARDSLAHMRAYLELSRLFEEQDYKPFQAIPLQTSYIPGHFQIDTVILYNHILEKPRKLKRNERDEIWSRVFNLQHGAFNGRSNMKSAFSIITDGFSASVLLGSENTIKRYKRKSAGAVEQIADDVADDILQDNINGLTGRNIVAIDINKRDILFCRDINGLQFRFTSNTRRVQTQAKKNKKIQKKLHVASNVNPILAEVSHHRMNTTSMDDYIVALRVRAAHNARLENFYGQVIFRKMKFRAYIGEQRCDASMFKNIISTFGKDAIFVIGNWNDAGHTRRFQVPTISSSWLSRFRKEGLTAYMIDEHLTSSVCPRCRERVSSVQQRRLSSRPWRKKIGATEKIHGLLVCKNPNCVPKGKQFRFFNRDSLAAENMLIISKSIIAGHGRPRVYRRTINK